MSFSDTEIIAEHTSSILLPSICGDKELDLPGVPVSEGLLNREFAKELITEISTAIIGIKAIAPAEGRSRLMAFFFSKGSSFTRSLIVATALVAVAKELINAADYVIDYLSGKEGRCYNSPLASLGGTSLWTSLSSVAGLIVAGFFTQRVASALSFLRVIPAILGKVTGKVPLLKNLHKLPSASIAACFGFTASGVSSLMDLANWCVQSVSGQEERTLWEVIKQAFISTGVGTLGGYAGGQIGMLGMAVKDSASSFSRAAPSIEFGGDAAVGALQTYTELELSGYELSWEEMCREVVKGCISDGVVNFAAGRKQVEVYEAENFYSYIRETRVLRRELLGLLEPESYTDEQLTEIHQKTTELLQLAFEGMYLANPTAKKGLDALARVADSYGVDVLVTRGALRNGLSENYSPKKVNDFDTIVTLKPLEHSDGADYQKRREELQDQFLSEYIQELKNVGYESPQVGTKFEVNDQLFAIIYAKHPDTLESEGYDVHLVVLKKHHANGKDILKAGAEIAKDFYEVTFNSITARISDFEIVEGDPIAIKDAIKGILRFTDNISPQYHLTDSPIHPMIIPGRIPRILDYLVKGLTPSKELLIQIIKYARDFSPEHHPFLDKTSDRATRDIRRKEWVQKMVKLLSGRELGYEALKLAEDMSSLGEIYPDLADDLKGLNLLEVMLPGLKKVPSALESYMKERGANAFARIRFLLRVHPGNPFNSTSDTNISDIHDFDNFFRFSQNLLEDAPNYLAALQRPNTTYNTMKTIYQVGNMIETDWAVAKYYQQNDNPTPTHPVFRFIKRIVEKLFRKKPDSNPWNTVADEAELMAQMQTVFDDFSAEYHNLHFDTEGNPKNPSDEEKKPYGITVQALKRMITKTPDKFHIEEAYNRVRVLQTLFEGKTQLDGVTDSLVQYLRVLRMVKQTLIVTALKNPLDFNTIDSFPEKYGGMLMDFEILLVNIHKYSRTPHYVQEIVSKEVFLKTTAAYVMLEQESLDLLSRGRT